MATDKEFIIYALEQLRGLDGLETRKMFGEYMIYRHGRPVLLVCDDTPFVKILPETTAILGQDAATGYPYDGAKLHYVLDIDDVETAEEVLKVLTEITPLPKKKSKKEQK